MKKIHLYNDNAVESYTEKADKISMEIGQALRPIFEKAYKENICLRELGDVAHGEVMILTSEFLLRCCK
jgi:hypothetical protein